MIASAKREHIDASREKMVLLKKFCDMTFKLILLGILSYEQRRETYKDVSKSVTGVPYYTKMV